MFTEQPARHPGTDECYQMSRSCPLVLEEVLRIADNRFCESETGAQETPQLFAD